MIKIRNKTLVLLNSLIDEKSAFHSFIQNTLITFFDVIKNYYLAQFSSIDSVYLRHSLVEENQYNAFFSDIDYTIVITDESQLQSIVKFSSVLRCVFPFLDTPEIYLLEENQLIEQLEHEEIKKYLDVIWNIRKINWQKAREDLDLYDQLKRDRSLAKSKKRVLIDQDSPVGFHISNLQEFASHFSNEKVSEITLYSYFLSTHTNDAIRLELTNKDFQLFNSLMPGENYLDFGSHSKNNKLEIIKSAIEAREHLTALNGIRFSHANQAKMQALVIWEEYLKSRNAIKKFKRLFDEKIKNFNHKI